MHIVILGGGLVGLSALTTLSKQKANGKLSDLQITLVDPKAFVEVRWAAVRALFDSSIATASVVPYSSILPAHPCATHILARAVSVDSSAHTVTLDTPDSTPLSYDVLLCATGSETSQQILTPQVMAKDAESRLAELGAYGADLIKASSILVVGGGSIGVELAGDVKGYATLKGNADCTVTLVQSPPDLVPGYGPKAARLVREQLEKRGIKVRTNTKAYPVEDSSTRYELKSSDGNSEEMEFDSVFSCVGVKPAAQLLPGDDKGFILTDEYGRVPGCSGRVFAYGDCVAGEPKSGSTALGHKDSLVQNIVIAAKNESTGEDLHPKGMKKIKPSGFIPAIFTTGPDSGVAALPFGTTTWIIPGMKNRSMLISHAKDHIGW